MAFSSRSDGISWIPLVQLSLVRLSSAAYVWWRRGAGVVLRLPPCSSERASSRDGILVLECRVRPRKSALLLSRISAQPTWSDATSGGAAKVGLDWPGKLQERHPGGQGLFKAWLAAQCLRQREVSRTELAGSGSSGAISGKATGVHGPCCPAALVEIPCAIE